ncbi:helix-turn-helix domain-containing protein [Actinoplanes sp. NPDC051346]|uniref:ArsR/SmtB family transcription factor n=1 Tax=Actinoplanes sp. NPDC051346 TaxID=3155048 RepID=UPI003418A897
MARPKTQPRILEHPESDAITVQSLFEALADPVRREIVRHLADVGEHLSCGAFDLPVTRSTMTHHFSVLREAGLVRQYYAGTMKMNALRADDLEARFPGLLPALLTAMDRER